MKLKLSSLLSTLSILALASALSASAQGTNAFTYQGRLTGNAGAASGLFDFRAQLYNRAAAGAPGDAQVGPTLAHSAMPVSNGLFTLTLDFGAGAFNGEARWLQLLVRTNGASAFSALAPRQPLTPAPYALFSAISAGLAAGASPTFTGGVTFNPAAGPPFSVGSPTKVPDLNADLLDGIDSTAFVRRAGDAMTGDLALAPPATLRFGSQTRQMIHLFDSLYGIGVQANTTYFRSHNHFAWFKDGTHADSALNPGAGGSTLMTLDASGNLVAKATTGTAIWGDASGAGFGVGVRGDGGGPFGLGVYGRAPFPFSVGVRGLAEGTNSAGITGEATATSTETWGIRGLAHSGSGSGVAGENNTASGIGVYGLNGGTAGSRTPAGVYGESLQLAGNGVVGVANGGPSAYGVWGRSTSGFAGAFDGAVRVSGNSTHEKPFLQVHETQDGDYARIQLQVASRPLWHISVGGADNSLVFYNSANSIVSSISESGVLSTKVLTITGGADIAEPFAMSEPELPKGAVVVIDEEHPGKLKLSTEAYDRRVAGIISGAGGVNTGLSLSQHGVMEGDQHVALTGRVYVQADASNGPIKPGDLLTTSATPGRAMKVTEPARAQGATLGKAMSALKDGTGLVLALVTLQ